MCLIEAITEISSLFNRLGEKRNNDANCYCHNVFASRDLNDTNTPQYAWQWNLTIQEYDKIKGVLTEHAPILKQVIQQNKICCKLLQMYVSEWYKREYNGNDRQGNAFSMIGIPYLAEDICKVLLDDDENRVYWSNTDDNGNNCGQREWLYTIYVDGGLPLRYLLNTENNRFRNAIEGVLEAKAEGLDLSLVDFGDLCNNNVVNQSFCARQLFPEEDEASIYDFIDEVIIKNNLLIEGFESFIELIRESNEKSLRNKFEIRYKVFKTDRSFQLVPQLFLKLEPNGVRYSISQERLDVWGIPSIDNKIQVKITSNDKLIWSKDFYKCLRGDYIPSAKNDLFDLWFNDNTRCLDKWDVYVGENKVTKLALKNSLEEHGYIQLYSVNGYSWSSQASSNYNYSAVLFDRNQEISLNEDDETIITTNREQLPWGWKQIEDQLQFTINGTLVTLYEKAGIIEVKPQKQHELSKFMANNPNDLVLLTENEKPSFEVVLTKKGIYGEPVPETIDKNQLLLKYRRSSAENFDEWHDSSCLKLGYFQCQVSIKAKEKSKTIDCFALPKWSETNKKLIDNENLTTSFRGFGELTISINNEVLRDDNGVKRMHWQRKQIDYHNPSATYTISDGNKSFDITYPQPIDAVVFKRKTNGVLFDVGCGDNEIKLPIRIIDRLDAFRLPENTKIEIDKLGKIRKAFRDLITHNYESEGAKQTELPYITFKTFTNVFKWDFNEKKYTIQKQKGEFDLTALRFVIAPTRAPLSYKQIDLKSNETEYYFDVSKCTEESLILQQINKYDIPKSYIKPIYVPAPNNIRDLELYERKNQRFNRISKYHNSYCQNLSDVVNEAIDYFELAAQTGNYFGCFDALLGLVCQYSEKVNGLVLSEEAPVLLANFVNTYIKRVDNIDFKSLWRMADEFLFDWVLMPRVYWDEREKECVSDLLRCNVRYVTCNDYQNFINQYWDFEYKKKITVKLEDSQKEKKTANKKITPEDKRKRDANIFIRTILGCYSNGQGTNSKVKACFWKLQERRTSFLEAISNNEFINFVNKHI